MAGGRLRRALRGAGKATTTSRPSGASTCSTTAPRASRSSSTPRTAGAGRRRSPACRSRSASVKYEGVLYRKLYDYTGKVTYVLGEFYWQVTRDQRTANTDYVGTGAASAKRLNREQTEGEGTQEIVWSAGETLSADAVLKAFRLAPDKRAALQRDALADDLQGLAARQDLLLDLHRHRRADAVSLRRRRRRRRLQRDSQHLRRRVAGVPELPEQPAQRRRLSQRRRLVRRLFQRRRAQAAPRTAAHHGSFFDRRNWHDGHRMAQTRGLHRLDRLCADRRAGVPDLLSSSSTSSRRTTCGTRSSRRRTSRWRSSSARCASRSA